MKLQTRIHSLPGSTDSTAVLAAYCTFDNKTMALTIDASTMERLILLYHPEINQI